jgi:hypothetical protein
MSTAVAVVLTVVVVLLLIAGVLLAVRRAKASGESPRPEGPLFDDPDGEVVDHAHPPVVHFPEQPLAARPGWERSSERRSRAREVEARREPMIHQSQHQRPFAPEPVEPVDIFSDDYDPRNPPPVDFTPGTDPEVGRSAGYSSGDFSAVPESTSSGSSAPAADCGSSGDAGGSGGSHGSGADSGGYSGSSGYDSGSSGSGSSDSGGSSSSSYSD